MRAPDSRAFRSLRPKLQVNDHLDLLWSARDQERKLTSRSGVVRVSPRSFNDQSPDSDAATRRPFHPQTGLQRTHLSPPEKLSIANQAPRRFEALSRGGLACGSTESTVRKTSGH